MKLAPKSRLGWALCGLAAAIVAVIAACTVILMVRWPFTRANITNELQNVSDSKVEIQSFHATYFPRPGCVAQGVVFHHRLDVLGHPFITIGSLRIEGRIPGLFSQHLARISAQGVHVTVAHGMQETFPGAKTSQIIVQELMADDSVLEFSSADPAKKALTFPFHQFRLHNVGRQVVMSFDVMLANPLPAGDIATHGQLGPWLEKREQTP